MAGWRSCSHTRIRSGSKSLIWAMRATCSNSSVSQSRCSSASATLTRASGHMPSAPRLHQKFRLAGSSKSRPNGASTSSVTGWLPSKNTPWRSRTTLVRSSVAMSTTSCGGR